MKNDKIVKAYNAIQPDEDAKNRVRAKLMQSALSAKKNSGKQFYKRTRVAAVAAVAAVILIVFGTTLFNQTGDIFMPENLFVMRVYAMELQPDGTYIRREVDITQLHGWGVHYDGETLFIGLGLWFDFEGENIRNIEFSLKDGFFATQYIGNRGAVPNTPSHHVGIPPYFTTSRLVMYGFDFDKIGDTITFESTMPDDILLFWGSHGIGYMEWLLNDSEVSIDVKVIFEDGEIHTQPLVLDFSDGFSMGWMDAGLFTTVDVDGIVRLTLFTNEQLEYIETAPLEHFTLLPYATRELDEYILAHEIYISGYDLITIVTESFIHGGIKRIPLGKENDTGFVAIVTITDEGITVNAYSIPLSGTDS